MALLVLALGLAAEALVSLAAPLGPLGAHGRGRRPAELLALMVDQGILLALPLYTASYVLMAAGHYVSSIPLAEGGETEDAEVLPAAVPILAAVFADYNMVDLAVLGAAALLVLRRYGAARLPAVLFYAVLAASHALPSLIALGYAAWWVVPASTLLRGLAPLLLAAAARLGRGV